jgi:hypothetical protein
MQGDVFVDTDGMVDAAGNRFSLLAQAVPANGNDTYITLYKITPQGTFVSWVFRPSQGQKIDKANLLRSGNDVIVEAITHAITSNKPRLLMKESAVVQGVFVTTASYEGEEGGAGAYTGGELPPQEVGVTKAEVEEVVREVIGLRAGSLVQAIAGRPESEGGQIRQGLEDKVKDAIRELNMHSASMQDRGVDRWVKDRQYEMLTTDNPRMIIGYVLAALEEYYGEGVPEEPDA